MVFGTFELCIGENIHSLSIVSPYTAAQPAPLMWLANWWICFENMHNYKCMRRTAYTVLWSGLSEVTGSIYTHTHTHTRFSVAQHFALNIIWHNNNFTIDRHLASCYYMNYDMVCVGTWKPIASLYRISCFDCNWRFHIRDAGLCVRSHSKLFSESYSQLVCECSGLLCVSHQNNLLIFAH